MVMANGNQNGETGRLALDQVHAKSRRLTELHADDDVLALSS